MGKALIAKLLRRALQEDDLEMASLCELALEGDEDARDEVEERYEAREQARLDGAA